MGEDKQPVVSGISPAEGPPGTLVKIRGENLGVNEADILGTSNSCYTSLSFIILSPDRV